MRLITLYANQNFTITTNFMRIYLNAALFIISLLFSMNTSAQINIDTLKAKAALYAQTTSSDLLFIHTDKTLYTNNEQIWFAAYLINNGNAKINDHSILSISLMREDDKKIFTEQQHVMLNGLSDGSIIIPENIPPGNYLFNACTNVLNQQGKPIAVFSRPLTIKSVSQSRFKATLTLLDSVITNGTIRASVNVEIKDEKRKGKPTITYSITNGKKQKTTLRDDQSSTVISVPATQLNTLEPVLLTEIAYNFDTVFLSVKLPALQPKGLNVRFFPEGGNLINGAETVIGIESITSTGLPIAISGVLYRNNQPVKTINTNAYGAGRFSIKPTLTDTYTFRCKANNYLEKDTTYQLPAAIEDGIALHLTNAVVNDTLTLALYSKTSKKAYVLLHNYKETFELLNVDAGPAGNKISIAINQLPRGLSTITLLDEQYRPLAERIFFAHYDKKINATININKNNFSTRDSAAAVIKLSDYNDQPLQGTLSVAVVQESRLESAKQRDIESNTFLNYNLGELPSDPTGLGFRNKTYLEDILLIKGWRRYTWQHLMKSKATGFVVNNQQPQYNGNVLRRTKPINEKVRLLVLKNSTFDTLTTASDGSFTLNSKFLVINEGKKVRLWAKEMDEKGYTITLNNPFKSINRELADGVYIPPRGIAQPFESSADHELKDIQKNIILKAVEIKGKKNNGPMYGLRNECGDYVCEAGYLNCPYHPPSKSKVYAPVKGQAIQGGVYQGCTSTGQEVLAIYNGREFYGLNRSKDGLLEKQYLSTIFWKANITTNENGEARLSFFTADITGNFKVIVQGLTSNLPVYAEADLTVK